MPERAYGALIVCSLAMVKTIVGTAPRPTAVLSILTPTLNLSLPRFRVQGVTHFTIRFHDCWEDVPEAPTEKDLRTAMQFVQSHETTPAMVIHCEQGLSRSPAIALMALMLRLGPGHEVEAVNALHAIQDNAAPNLRLVHLTEQVLGLRPNALIEAVCTHPQISLNVRGTHQGKPCSLPYVSPELREFLAASPSVHTH